MVFILGHVSPDILLNYEFTPKTVQKTGEGTYQSGAQWGESKTEEYHKKRLDELLRYVFDKIEEYEKGKMDVFELDYVIHIFHKQSQELFSFINTFYPRNSELPKLLQLMEEEENGEWWWEPKTKQKY